MRDLPISHLIVYCQLILLVILGLLVFFDEVGRPEAAGISIIVAAIIMAACYVKACWVRRLTHDRS